MRRPGRPRSHEERLAGGAAREGRQQVLRIAVVIVVLLGAGWLVLHRPAASGGLGSVVVPDGRALPVLPPVRKVGLRTAVLDSGCLLARPAVEGTRHATGTISYRSNPPASGPHDPVAALDGVYASGKEPSVGHWVHALEHGRVIVEYSPAATAGQVDQLRSLAAEPLHGSAFYKVLVMRNTTRMPYRVAAIAWGRVLGCGDPSGPVFDALRAFRKAFTDRGPELIR